MNKERLRNLVNIGSLGFLASILFSSPFSIRVRKEIGKRDNWHCQDPDCDKCFADGWMVHAAHDPEHHSKSDPQYNSPDSGDIRCVEHHLEQHLDGTSLGDRKDGFAIQKLEETDHRTRKWRQQYGERNNGYFFK